MPMTKQDALAKARAAKLEARADTSTPSVEPAAESYAYRYVGGLGAVLVVMDGTAYEARQGEVLHLPHAIVHPDFVKARA